MPGEKKVRGKREKVNELRRSEIVPGFAFEPEVGAARAFILKNKT